MLWLLILLIVGLLVWVHIALGMNVRDRVDVALEIARTSEFEQADGFPTAVEEDPDLVGWVKSGSDCIMLFRTQQSEQTNEIVDFSSGSFHPGLVIYCTNGVATRTDAGELTSERIRNKASQLLRETKRVVSAVHSQDNFGFRD